ncbi:hypothetical protein CRG98_009609 [Punica granatum]|uniref:Uncharacterized protein n=1 Tax=Punica granatum TaxID=22663 RepID=A0A2I0KQD6_PUNGR|nr:hypothetical protein CRG98_009609 [Punica granatum]
MWRLVPVDSLPLCEEPLMLWYLAGGSMSYLGSFIVSFPKYLSSHFLGSGGFANGHYFQGSGRRSPNNGAGFILMVVTHSGWKMMEK